MTAAPLGAPFRGRATMSTRFFVNRQGSMLGPLSSSELKQLVARGELDREDLLRREEDAQWNPAGKFKGLFEATAASASADSQPPQAPAPEPQPVQPGASPTPSESAAAVKVKAAVADQVEKWRPLAERYSRDFELGMNEFLAVAAGAACLALLLFSTFFRWEKWTTTAGAVLKGVTNWKIYGGLEIFEGKLVCLLAVVGLVAVAAPFVVKKVLPISLLLGAGVGTCCVLLTMSYMHQISAYQREMDRQSGIVQQNFETQFGQEGGQKMSEMVVPTESDTAGFGLYLSFLCSVIVAATFVFAALSKPVAIPALQKESVHPLARKHGGLLIAVGAGFLIGMADYVFKY